MNSGKSVLKLAALMMIVVVLLKMLVERPIVSARTPDESDPENTYAGIDAYIEQQLHDLSIPGVSLGIVEDDRIVHLRGFGQARPGGEAPSPQTPFLICSLTKSITALAVMQLVEAGKIDLDSPVQQYLPWFRVDDPQASASITVRHLMNQTSSLGQLPGMLALVDFDGSPAATERQARSLASFTSSRPVGSAFEYSNMNYNLLGLIIEAVSGEPYPEYIQKHVFMPLDMRHSYTSQVEAKQNGIAMGYRYWFAIPVVEPNLPIPRGSLPSGQLISSTEDMTHYLIAHLNAGRYGDVRLLSPSGIDELHQGVAQADQMGVSMGRYAMGWFDHQIGQTRVLWHHGESPDYFAYMAILPEQKKGVVLLVNVDQSMMNMVLTEVAEGVMRRLAGEQTTPSQLGAIPWISRGLLLIPLLQIAGVALTLRRLWGWRHNPALRPSRRRLWSWHILWPLIPNLSLAALPVVLWLSGMLRFITLFMPDLAWTCIMSGGFAGLWSVLRTGLILRTLRESIPPDIHGISG